MRKVVKLRDLTSEEEAEVRRIAGSRKEAHRLVQRAKVIAAMLDDPKLPASHAGQKAGFESTQMGVQPQSVVDKTKTRRRTRFCVCSQPSPAK